LFRVLPKFKRNSQKVIRISVWDTSSIVQGFKIIKFKRILKKKVIRISVLDISRISEMFSN
jgi:hypothetical protein